MSNFGPPLKSNHTEKEWTYKKSHIRTHMICQQIIQDLELEYDILFWTYFYKFYGAEWHEDNT